jgi:hypothetical protein
MKPLRLIVVIALFAFEGCGDHGGPPTKQEIAGVYKGRYAGGIETIDIRINGSFSQDFRVGSSLVYTSNGTWDIQGKNLSFTPFAFPTEILRMKGDGRSQKVGSAPGLWARGPIHIEFGPWPYHVAKVDGEGSGVDESAFKMENGKP